MRYIIYGAGGIGSIMGGHLFRTGHQVILIGRPGHVNAVNKNGLRLITPTSTHVLKIPAVTSPGQIDLRPDDLVFLCMKGQDTEAALQDLKKVIADIPVFCFQNGVRNEEIAAEYFTGVYGVMVRVGAVYLTDGEVIARRDPPGWYIIGKYPRGTDELAETAADSLRTAGYFVKTSDDVMPYKWGKLMANVGNAVGAITSGSWQDMMPVFHAVLEEAAKVVEKAGIKWISQEQIAEDWPEITAPLRGQLNTEAQSSTWQSLTRRQGSVETDFLNGEIVRLAERLGMEAPLNRKLIEITREMAVNHEPPGKYTLSQLSDILGINTAN
ncbi:MAG TPA: ketopantoate reductase family protein [Dehalococcoidia bacterium]|nr:ketopantoate reductase family protein [Dehalococcoidia bacterium]